MSEEDSYSSIITRNTRLSFGLRLGGELLNEESYLDVAQRELLEETGLKLEIGVVLKERDEVYAVARSIPARWQEKYYLVDCPNDPQLSKDGWFAAFNQVYQQPKVDPRFQTVV